MSRECARSYDAHPAAWWVRLFRALDGESCGDAGEQPLAKRLIKCDARRAERLKHDADDRLGGTADRADVRRGWANTGDYRIFEDGCGVAKDAARQHKRNLGVL